MATLNNQSSLSEITESVRHINEVFLPSIKQKLASKTHFGAENTFNALIDNIALDKLGGVKWATGSLSITTASNYVVAYKTVSGLSFRPKLVMLFTDTIGAGKSESFGEGYDVSFNSSGNNYIVIQTFRDSSFEAGVKGNGTSYTQRMKWIAIG